MSSGLRRGESGLSFGSRGIDLEYIPDACHFHHGLGPWPNTGERKLGAAVLRRDMGMDENTDPGRINIRHFGKIHDHEWCGHLFEVVFDVEDVIEGDGTIELDDLH